MYFVIYVWSKRCGEFSQVTRKTGSGFLAEWAEKLNNELEVFNGPHISQISIQLNICWMCWTSQIHDGIHFSAILKVYKRKDSIFIGLASTVSKHALYSLALFLLTHIFSNFT